MRPLLEGGIVGYAVQSLNSLNDQIASFMVTGPKALEQEEPAFRPPEKETMQKSMTLMRHLLVDAQPTLSRSCFCFFESGATNLSRRIYVVDYVDYVDESPQP
ncbi:putative kazrin-like [Scophthalmus maximus]|uniref:Putative kazrin-like n=1 Tax=Scophthalmus maximus TaxID=52904 RepID=A0A2U9C0K4_SCOMX|nr:putative kazrin-like [Scophthalmus maximus]